MNEGTPEFITLYCTGCQEPTSFPARVMAEMKPGELFVWDCRPCGHRNRTAMPGGHETNPEGIGPSS